MLACMFECVRVCVRMYLCMYVSMCVCLYVYVCTCVCMCLRMYVYMCVCERVCTHTYTYTSRGHYIVITNKGNVLFTNFSNLLYSKLILAATSLTTRATVNTKVYRCNKPPGLVI